MIKYIVLSATLVCMAYSQRPTYAGSGNRRPVVLPQYLTTPKPAASLANRIDGDQNASGVVIPSTTAPTIAPIPLDLPVGAMGDANLVDTIKTWPRDQQPFWYINQQQIKDHIGVGNIPGTATQSPQTHSRSFFAG